MEELLSYVEEDEKVRDEILVPSTFAVREKSNLGNHDINYIILAVNYEGINTGKSTHDIKLLGKTMLDWVKSACPEQPNVKKVDSDFDVLRDIKDLLTDSEWTIVLFSDTPLLTNDTLEKSFSFAEESGLNVCKLKRGYIFKTDYIRRIEDIYGVENCLINLEDFLVADNFVTINKASTILKNRILDYHMRNGVFIMDRSSTYIDCEVSIGRGTFIHPGNYLYGSTEIGEDVQLFSGNRILNSIIAGDAKIESSTISLSVIGEKCKIKNSNIGNDTLIKSSTKVLDGSVVKESIIDEECKIMNATVKGVAIAKNCKIYDGARIIGKNGNIAIENNVTIGENCVINVPCVVQEGKRLSSGTIINK